MANADLEPSGLIARTSALLNNSVLSDVEFHVKNGSNIEKFHAHRLILAVSGKGFFDLLSNATNSSTIIKISDLSPHAVYLMLKYLYTDSLSLLKMEDAIELFRLAKKYSITDLEKICCKYIMKEEINIDNLFVKYESALACNFDELLQNCRKLVQSETKAVFASKYFGHASFSVIEDILSQNCLNVSSELEVIHAALKWSECECKRKGRPTEKICVRDAIEPLLKYLRFLSLTADEFCDFVEKYNIFTGYESTLFTRKILQPQTNVPLSKQFCSITRPRQAYARSNSSMVNATNFNDYYADFLKSPDPFLLKNMSSHHQLL
ncbi:hypothetical protein CEXT_303681 [Caerostris extrusa]|uniref:BTB domain-containing protein n=1 Tax=Caerostris extrusa TaxID=172846 RepID=A0AAV4VF07_CAEEX|nr:hypothetical protein CEXT_303681 [Caerostris extrusa]